MMAENDAVEEGKAEEIIDDDMFIADDELQATIEEDEVVEAEAEPVVERKKRRDSPALRQIMTWFAACGRCSFFLAGYRLICDEEALETAVANRSKKWLVVPWSHALAELIHKTYGSRIDISCYHFEGQCVECHRRFTFQGSEKDDEPATFRIELKP
ncbi:MAG: hypothetical protein H6667_12920 [Ardenticatenaceae bacterium]|nr:hypothetical protein [Ardenticatenaceae bacterium]MCB9442645.1 hypothetical protein [Ardenticatenaceae bacterium]